MVGVQRIPPSLRAAALLLFVCVGLSDARDIFCEQDLGTDILATTQTDLRLGFNERFRRLLLVDSRFSCKFFHGVQQLVLESRA